jgi:hypothetical protein
MRALREFARPLPLAAAALLALNDHVLKGAGLLPAWLTGKLSDLAGLFFFPILLFSLTSLVRPPVDRIRHARALAFATGAVFSALKVVPMVNAWVAPAWAIVMDPTDLFALPVLGLSVLYLRARPRVPALEPRGGDLWRAAAVLLAAVASVATSPPRNARNYPAWQVVGPTAVEADCVLVTPFVVKSGKEGIGVVVALRGLGPCATHLAGARVVVGDLSFAGTLGESRLDPNSPMVRTYVAFPFDNNTLWNEGRHEGTLELVLETASGPARLAFNLREIWESTHKSVWPESMASPSAAPVATPSAGARE